MESPQLTAGEPGFADTLRLSLEIEGGPCPTVNLKLVQIRGATDKSFAAFFTGFPRFMPLSLPRANFRFGSESEVCGRNREVRFTPENGLKSDMAPCPSCATSGSPVQARSAAR
jgi:hypothetical protein